MQASTKPAIFISSTIYDFRDLRSSLKFWLEQLGYEVMLSEFNDFTKPLDENSYTACLKSIERAHYFILLIGARTGGLFDATQKVSITRTEYRTAYGLVKAGRMKLITFVREDVWNIKEDRNALRNLLRSDYAKQRELSEAEVEAITKHPSSFVNDAEATFSFLREVGRIDEMKQAMAGKANLPIANWIHPFSSFQDIADTLSTILNTKRSLSTIALITNLKRELLSNLSRLTSKNKKGEVNVHTVFGDFARSQFKGDLKDSSLMPARYIKWLGMYGIFGASGRKLSTQFIDQALTSGAFLEFDFNLNSYKIGVFHNALFQLKENINHLKDFSDGYVHERVIAFLTKYAPKNNPSVNSEGNLTISNEDLLPIFACLDCEQNVSALCIALLKALEGNNDKLFSLKLNRSNPSEVQATKIEAESTTVEEIEAWLVESAQE
jgi:hypothetical protein